MPEKAGRFSIFDCNAGRIKAGGCEGNAALALSSERLAMVLRPPGLIGT